MIWAAILTLPLLILLIGLAFRPWYLFRGLTSEEKRQSWPGDHLVTGALPSGSRGITIHTPSEEVWPWITQIGQDRAGFYSYRWLENLARAEMPDIKQKVPVWSARNVGEQLIMAPIKRYGKIAAMDIVEVKPSSYFVAKNVEGTWAFILVPIDHQTCRLIARGTWAPSKNLLGRFLHAAIFDPIHYIMEWKMVRQLKRLAENAWQSRAVSQKGLDGASA